jgi:hypothetical protein
MYTSLAQSANSLQNALNNNALMSMTSSQLEGGQDRDVSVQSKMEQSLAHSITLVFWYAAAKDPVRLLLELPTFPLFQLSLFDSIVSDLNLSSLSYIDMYNEATGYWEQRGINAVRTVVGGQRLLCKVRKSLLQGMEDKDCVGLNEEVQMQSRPQPIDFNGAKRPAEDSEDAPAQKYYIVEGYQPRPQIVEPQQSYAPPSPFSTQSYPKNLSTPTPTSAPPLPQNASSQTASASTSTSSSTSNKSTQYLYAPSAFTPLLPLAPIPPHISSPHTPAPPIPYHPHPPLKRWPNDYTVSEVAHGFRLMDSLSHPAINSTSQVTQKVAFERVFGSRYVIPIEARRV